MNEPRNLPSRGSRLGSLRCRCRQECPQAPASRWRKTLTGCSVPPQSPRVPVPLQGHACWCTAHHTSGDKTLMHVGPQQGAMIQAWALLALPLRDLRLHGVISHGCSALQRLLSGRASQTWQVEPKETSATPALLLHSSRNSCKRPSQRPSLMEKITIC